MKINKTKNLFFEKHNKIDTPTAKLIKKKKTDSPNMNEKQNITTNPIEIEKTISKYYKHLYGIILHNLDEMDEFLQTQIV